MKRGPYQARLKRVSNEDFDHLEAPLKKPKIECKSMTANEFKDQVLINGLGVKLKDNFQTQLSQLNLTVTMQFQLNENPTGKLQCHLDGNQSLGAYLSFDEEKYQVCLDDTFGQLNAVPQSFKSLMESLITKEVIETRAVYTLKNPLSPLGVRKLLKYLEDNNLMNASIADLLLNLFANFLTLKEEIIKSLINNRKHIFDFVQMEANPKTSDEVILNNLNQLLGSMNETQDNSSELPSSMKVNARRVYGKLSSKFTMQLRANSKGKPKLNIDIWNKQDKTLITPYARMLVKHMLTKAKRPKIYEYIQKTLLSSNEWNFNSSFANGIMRIGSLPGGFDEKVALKCYQYAQNLSQDHPIVNIGDPSVGWGNRVIATAAWSKHIQKPVTYYGIDPQYSSELYKQRLDNIVSFCQTWNPEVTYCIRSGQSQKPQTIQLWKDSGVLIDSVLTSPPYLGVEKYAGSLENQAFKRHNTYDEWNSFYIDYINNFMSILHPQGVFMLNIPSPIRKTNQAFWSGLHTIIHAQYNVHHSMSLSQQVAATKAASSSSEVILFLKPKQPVTTLLASQRLNSAVETSPTNYNKIEQSPPYKRRKMER